MCDRQEVRRWVRVVSFPDHFCTAKEENTLVNKIYHSGSLRPEFWRSNQIVLQSDNFSYTLIHFIFS